MGFILHQIKKNVKAQSMTKLTPVPLNAIPKHLNFNPSKWSQRVYTAILATIAALIAAYMGLYEWKLIDYVWDPVFGTTMDVLDSDLSHEITQWIRIPDAILGSLGYIGDIVLALAGSTRRWMDRPWIVFIFGLNVIPVGIVSAILVAMQGLVVHAWCFPCLIAATISLILILLTYKEVHVSLLFLYHVYKRSKRFSVVWDTFWGKASFVAHEVATEMTTSRDWRI